MLALKNPAGSWELEILLLVSSTHFCSHFRSPCKEKDTAKEINCCRAEMLLQFATVCFDAVWTISGSPPPLTQITICLPCYTEGVTVMKGGKYISTGERYWWQPASGKLKKLTENTALILTFLLSHFNIQKWVIRSWLKSWQVIGGSCQHRRSR